MAIIVGRKTPFDFFAYSFIHSFLPSSWVSDQMDSLGEKKDTKDCNGSIYPFTHTLALDGCVYEEERERGVSLRNVDVS